MFSAEDTLAVLILSFMQSHAFSFGDLAVRLSTLLSFLRFYLLLLKLLIFSPGNTSVLNALKDPLLLVFLSFIDTRRSGLCRSRDR